MASYLLTCDCGQSQKVDVGQAGGQLVCPCGRKLDVPTLRKLRHLPQAPDELADSAPIWNPRKGVVAVFLILAGLLAALTLGSRITEPTLPTFDPAAQTKFVDQGLTNLTPVQAWQVWTTEYRPLAEKGFAVMESPATPIIRDQIARKRFLQVVMLSVAAACVVLAAIAAFWPRTASSRRRA